MERISIGSRIKNGWNAFMNKDPTPYSGYSTGEISYAYRPDRPRFGRGHEKSIVTAVLNRIAIDTAMYDIKHVRLDETGRYKDDMSSGLNDCFNWEANKDQSAFDFKLDVIISMLDEGCVAIVPVATDVNPTTGSWDVEEFRTARILEWFPDKVRVQIYNDRNGQKVEKILPKAMVAIVQNPLYSIMNEPNSTLQRLIRKLTILDVIDEQSGSGKLDLIIQLPYIIKSEARKAQARERKAEIERQLSGSKYGIAYTDATEKITQLNRSVENQLMGQIEFLTTMLYSQLGITQTILDGSADEQTMLNYYQRTINPIITALLGELSRKFISRTARTQGQAIMAFRDPFKLVPMNNIADMADKFTRNEIMSSNEFRQVIGLKPSDDPKADQLINSNLNHENEGEPYDEEEGYDQNYPDYEEEY